MIIKFKSINVDGEIREWEFSSVDELDREYWGDADLPSMDDNISGISFNDEPIGISALIGEDAVFSDLIVLLGIDTAR